MNVNIEYFDPSTIKDGAVVLIVGRRGSGKSTLAADILSYHRNCKRGVCVSATERANPFWGQFIPGCFIHSEYSERITKNLFRMQNKVKRITGEAEPAFAIYDDCMFNKSFVKSIETRRLFMNGRHSKIFTIVTTQWLMDVPPDLRANVDYAIILRDNIKANRERIYKYFAGMFSTFNAFDEVMQQCTTDREAMVINLGSLSYSISDCVFFYKATPGLKYKLGSQRYWDFSANHPGETYGRSNKKRMKMMSGNVESDDDDEGYEPREQLNVTKKYPTYQTRYLDALQRE